MIFLADLHLNRNGDTVLVSYPSLETTLSIPSRTADTLHRLSEAIDYAANTKQSVVIGGDVFDSSRPPFWVLGLLMELFKYAKSKGVALWIIPGNHDCDVSWGPDVLGKGDFDNVHYISTPVIATVDGYEVGFLPHIPRAQVEAIEKSTPFSAYVVSLLGSHVPILVSHAHVKGAVNSSDVEVEAGEAIAFDPALYPTFDMALFGHIHKGQQVGGVIYPGSVSTCDYSEAGLAHGFVEVLGLGKVRFIEFSHRGKEYKHVKIDLINKDAVEFPPEKVKSLVGGKLVKITVFTNDPLKVDEWDIRKAFNEFGYVTKFETIIHREESTAEFDEEEPTVSYETLYETWLTNKDGVSEELRSDALERGKTIIAAVLAKGVNDAEKN